MLIAFHACYIVFGAMLLHCHVSANKLCDLVFCLNCSPQFIDLQLVSRALSLSEGTDTVILFLV